MAATAALIDLVRPSKFAILLFSRLDGVSDLRGR
jgi:hypothetical protein